MSERRGWGDTVLGWFVVRDETTPTENAAQEPSAAEPASDIATPPPATFSGELPAAPGGKVDFAGVYTAAAIDDDHQGFVGKAVELLRSLPVQTEPAVKRQIVGASLKAFGVPVEKIIEAAVAEIQALEGYIQAGAEDTRKVHEEGEQRIAQLQDQIQKLRQVMDERVTEQQSVMKACNDQKLSIQQVLEFFGQDAVARVVRESPKLIDPSERKA
ncbi:MAG: hypothetical protein ACM3OB_07150 [Acidobacteriota bacterium]